MTAYALTASAGWKPPAWLTVHNLMVAVGLLVIVLLALAVLRLAGKKPVPVPAPAPKKSGGGGKLLLVAGLAVGGLLAWGHYKPAATGAKAAPAPSPTPTPHPTVTRTVTPPAAHSGSGSSWLANLTAWMNHLTGTDWVLIVLICAVVTFAIVRPLLRRGSD